MSSHNSLSLQASSTAPAPTVEEVRQASLLLAEHLQDYYEKYYKVAVRRIAHQVAVVMMRDIEHNFSVPVFRMYVPLDASPTAVYEAALKELLPALKKHQIVPIALNYDGAFQKVHCHDDKSDQALNLHDLAK